MGVQCLMQLFKKIFGSKRRNPYRDRQPRDYGIIKEYKMDEVVEMLSFPSVNVLCSSK